MVSLRSTFGLLGSLSVLLLSATAFAHGISESARKTMEDGGVMAYVWLGPSIWSPVTIICFFVWRDFLSHRFW